MPDYPIYPAVSPRLLCFSLYYEVPDHAFQIAAETWAPIMMMDVGFDPKRDILHMASVRTEADFRAQWAKLDDCRNSGAAVIEGHLFTHASWLGSAPGLEFAADPANKNDTTLTHDDISKLPPPVWHPSFGKLTLEGCSSGVKTVRGWCPAETYALRQLVSTEGRTGWGYFSVLIPQFVPVKADDAAPTDPVLYDKIYLWAFNRGRTIPLGTDHACRGQSTGREPPVLTLR